MTQTMCECMSCGDIHLQQSGVQKKTCEITSTFQILNDKKEPEFCGECDWTVFMIEKETNRILCDCCGEFLRMMESTKVSQLEMLQEMFEFAKRHGE